MEMTEERAVQILYSALGQLFNEALSERTEVFSGKEHYRVGPCLELYTADELEAIAFWMRNKGGEDGNN